MPQVLPHDVPEILGVRQAHQPVVVGHDQSAVNGVHPLDGKFHGPAAGNHALGQINMEDTLRRHREGNKLRVGKKMVKVGHEITPLCKS